MRSDSPPDQSSARPTGFGLLESSFANLLARLYPDAAPEDLSLLRLLAATLLLDNRRGHVVTSLSSLAGRPVPPGLVDVPVRYPPPFLITEALSRVRAGRDPFPVVFCGKGERAWLLRSRQTEERIALDLRRRASRHQEVVIPEEMMQALFGLSAPENTLRRCAETVLTRRLLILSGGPGTGKTTTLARLLFGIPSLLSIPPGRIALCAPTGKAASRLSESLSLAESGDFPGAIPKPVTLHRLLGQVVSRKEGDRVLLPIDLLVIDEMSMVDLALFDRVLGVLPPSSILILSGDRDQLSSVSPGSVFGEILKGVDGASSDDTADQMERSVTILSKSHRFGQDSGIGRLARWIRSGGAGELEATMLPGVTFRPLESLSLFWDEMANVYHPYGEQPDLAGAFGFLSGIGILSPLRQGPRGVTELSRQLERRLFPPAPAFRRSGLLPAGSPLVITRNDAEKGLSNGDVGIIPFARWGDTGRAFFLRGKSFHSVPVDLLPPFESALTLTVHKSQGNEFSRVHLLLPDAPHPLLTRELLYTAVTRAREHLTIWGDMAVFRSGVEAREERHSALGDFLWNPSSIS